MDKLKLGIDDAAGATVAEGAATDCRRLVQVILAGGSGTATPTGGSQPHENMQPFLVVNFIIALEGIFPSRN